MHKTALSALAAVGLSLAAGVTGACGDDGDNTSAAFCTQLADADGRLDELFAQAEEGGVKSRQAADGLVALMTDLRAAAPTDMRATYTAITDGLEAFRTELAEANFDVAAMGEPESLNDADTMAAFEKAASHGKSECDVNLDD